LPHRRPAAPQVITERGGLIVERDPARASGRLLRQAGMSASYNDLADPRHLEFDYLRWMRVVLRAAHARRVLHIGGAGCALARALAAAAGPDGTDGRQEVYEIDPVVVEIAREHLGLRRTPGLRVRVGDGVVGLAAAGDASRDAVVIDAFIGARVAPGPVAAAALSDAARVAPLCLVNVVDDRVGREVSAVAARLADVYAWVWAVGGRSENTVLVAGRGASPERARVGAALARDRAPASVEIRH
jgi:hypothetical protein